MTRTLGWVAILSLALVALSAAWFLYWRRPRDQGVSGEVSPQGWRRVEER